MEDPVESEKDGELNNDGEDAREGIYARLLVECERLERLFFFIPLVQFFEFLQFRLEPLHRMLGARGRKGEREEDESDNDGEQDDRDADIPARDERDERDERVINRIIESGVKNGRNHTAILRCLADFRKEPREFGAEVLVRQVGNGGTWEDDKGGGEREGAERRAHAALNLVPSYGEAGDFLWHHNRVAPPLRGHYNGKIG